VYNDFEIHLAKEKIQGGPRITGGPVKTVSSSTPTEQEQEERGNTGRNPPEIRGRMI
jgi:hypothetical protein